MKTHFYVIIFLTCSLIGLRNNAMEDDDHKDNYKTTLLEYSDDATKQNTYMNGIVQKTLDVMFLLKDRLRDNPPKTQINFRGMVNLIVRNPLFESECLNYVSNSSPHMSLLQIATLYKQDIVIKKLLVEGADPRIKGKHSKNSLEMINKNTFCVNKKQSSSRWKKSHEKSNITMYDARRALKCYIWIKTGEKCCNHRDDCDNCKKFYGEKQSKSIPSCKHREKCKICTYRLKSKELNRLESEELKSNNKLRKRKK